MESPQVLIPRSRRMACDDVSGGPDFSASYKAENDFGRKLRSIASHIGLWVRDMADGTEQSAAEIGRLLSGYSNTLTSWADAATRRMHAEVATRDKQQWMRYSAQMGVTLRNEIDSTPTGALFQRLRAEQMDLIKSIPAEAAQHVHDMTVGNMVEGKRPDEIRDEILRDVPDATKARATLIARTETARTASLMTQARAMNIGCTHYIWQTTRDQRVRPSHRRLQGGVFAFDDPPVSDVSGGKEYRSNPGQIWNCRCWAKPILPDMG